MSEKADNPFAFPVTPEIWATHHDFCGMTLRDWFAGQALTGFMASTKRPTTIAADDATWCFTVADAMLAARNEQS